MSWTVLGYCALIFFARIVDVSLGTIRTICVVYGRRVTAWILGFFEVLVWILVVSKVLTNMNDLRYAIAYALGFATGNYIGITIDKRIAFGQQVVRVFTRVGMELAEKLRQEGFGVTVFVGSGRDGPVEELFIQTPRRRTQHAAAEARKMDPECFIVVDDIRSASTATTRAMQPAAWLSVLKRK